MITAPSGNGDDHWAYLEEMNLFLLNHLILTGKLHAYLADLNEQAVTQYQHIIRQMMENEGVAAELKRTVQMRWVQHMNILKTGRRKLPGTF